MSRLETWVDQGWLKRHQSSAQEIGEQLTAADSDLADARKDLSNGWRFAIAYNAALRLCNVVLFAAGYCATREQKHYRTIAALPLIIDSDMGEVSTYLNQCRSKRHEVTYESMAIVSQEEADELISAVEDLQSRVRGWMARVYPELS